MITITKVLSAAKEFVKVLRYGSQDINTPEPSLPYGIDSKPIHNKRGIVAETRRKGKNVILGYILHSEKTESGEIRVYSTDNDGNDKFYIYLKKDGTCEIGGNVDNLVRYSKLDSGLQQFKDQIQQELSFISTGIASAGGSYTPSILSLDISDSKIDEIKSP